MSDVKLQSLAVYLTANIDDFERKLSRAQLTVKNFSSKMGLIAGGGIIAGVSAVGVAAYQSAKAFIEEETATTRLNAQLKANGYAAGYSGEALVKYAEGLETTTTYSHDAIIQAETLLTRFKHIQGVNFKGTIKAATDMAAAMGTDVSSAASLIARVINTPGEGMKRLARTGIEFSKVQKEQIANYMRMGETAKAQKVILDEINAKFGGTAAAMADTTAGRWAQIQNSLETIKETIGEMIVKESGLKEGLEWIVGKLKEAKEWVEANKFGLTYLVERAFIEIEFGIKQSWNLLNGFFENWFTSIVDTKANFEILFNWLNINFKTLAENFGQTFAGIFTGIFNNIKERVLALIDVVKNPSLESLKNFAEKSGEFKVVADVVKGVSDQTGVAMPEFVHSQYRNLADEMAGINEERIKRLDALEAGIIGKVNAQKNPEKVKPQAEGGHLIEAASFASKFAGAALKGSVEAYRAEIGKSGDTNKKIEKHADKTAKNTDAMQKSLASLASAPIMNMNLAVMGV